MSAVERAASRPGPDRSRGPDGPAPARVVPPVVWWTLGGLVAVEAVLEAFPVGVSPEWADWLHNVVLFAAVALCLGRSTEVARLRAAWLWIGVGLGAWALGDVLWAVLYDTNPSPPYPTIADPLWLAWYPLTAVGIALLVRARLARFELHRWMDGLAVMLIVLAAAAALLLEPVANETHDTVLATGVAFSYPVLDTLMIGGILGVYGLVGWHPGRMWLLLGLGCVVMAGADVVFAVQQAGGARLDSDYTFVWTAGAVLIAAAAWSSAPSKPVHHEVYGWRAIALPLGAQLLAAGIQIYGLFGDLGHSERAITLIVLAIASFQIIVSRPRPPGQEP